MQPESESIPQGDRTALTCVLGYKLTCVYLAKIKIVSMMSNCLLTFMFICLFVCFVWLFISSFLFTVFCLVKAPQNISILVTVTMLL